jgi:2TM domain
MYGLQMSLVIHTVVYVIVVGGLWRMNQQTTPGVHWVEYVAWGWGIGLAAHAAVWAMLKFRPKPSNNR